MAYIAPPGSKARKILDLHAAGYSIKEISQELYGNKSGGRGYVHCVLRSHQFNGDGLISKRLESIEFMVSRLYALWTSLCKIPADVLERRTDEVVEADNQRMMQRSLDRIKTKKKTPVYSFTREQRQEWGRMGALESKRRAAVRKLLEQQTAESGTLPPVAGPSSQPTPANGTPEPPAGPQDQGHATSSPDDFLLRILQ